MFCKCIFLHHSASALGRPVVPIEQSVDLGRPGPESRVQAVGPAEPWLDKPMSRPSASQGGQNTSMAFFKDATTCKGRPRSQFSFSLQGAAWATPEFSKSCPPSLSCHPLLFLSSDLFLPGAREHGAGRGTGAVPWHTQPSILKNLFRSQQTVPRTKDLSASRGFGPSC